MSELCWRPSCAQLVTARSHSPIFCSEACEAKARLELRGETTQPSPDVAQAPVPRPLSSDGYGSVVWSELSWWPHPKQPRKAAS